MYWPGRDYTARPNVGARLPGAGGGRSLVLSGHVDTVPIGAEPWTRDPFGGEIEGNRLYGRGSNDMKGGIATNLFVVEALRELDIRLAGDLVFESVVDEEFGGVNGTLAGRLMNFNADAAIISEPTSLRVCPAQRGGRTVQITFRSPNGGILATPRSSAVEQLRVFLNAIPDFQNDRLQRIEVPALYSHLVNPVPANVTRVHTAAWGTSEPSNIPQVCRVEFFWQAMPGESLDDVDRQFLTWFHSVVASQPHVFALEPHIEHPIRWLPGSALSIDHPLTAELASAATEVLGKAPLCKASKGRATCTFSTNSASRPSFGVLGAETLTIPMSTSRSIPSWMQPQSSSSLCAAGAALRVPHENPCNFSTALYGRERPKWLRFADAEARHLRTLDRGRQDAAGRLVSHQRCHRL